MKRLLMVAYFFPPVGGIGSAGAQRVLKFAKYLKHSQWEPVIVTVKESSYEPFLTMDSSLLDKIPAGTTIVRTGVFRGLTLLLRMKNRVLRIIGARGQDVSFCQHVGQPLRESTLAKKSSYQRMKDAITDLLEIPDEEMGWFFPGVLAGLGSFSRYRFDAIYSTGRPWTAHLIGLSLKLLTGRPLIVDFRDPWMTNPFRPEYSSLRDRLETTLERVTIEKADVVISNTAELQEEFVKRFPAQSPSKFHTLLNGFDVDDFEQRDNINGIHSGSHLTITHAGFLYGKRDPKTFLEALRRVIDTGQVNPDRLRVWFVGSIELSYDVSEYLSVWGLNKVVFLRPHVPYRDSLEFLRQSDVLLLLQPGTKTQIPSKLFEYIGGRKPILGISPLDGATARLMQREGLGVIADPENVDAIASAIRSVYDLWSHGDLSSMMNGTVHDRFDVRHITAQLAELLSRL